MWRISDVFASLFKSGASQDRTQHRRKLPDLEASHVSLYDLSLASPSAASLASSIGLTTYSRAPSGGGAHPGHSTVHNHSAADFLADQLQHISVAPRSQSYNGCSSKASPWLTTLPEQHTQAAQETKQSVMPQQLQQQAGNAHKQQSATSRPQRHTAGGAAPAQHSRPPPRPSAPASTTTYAAAPKDGSQTSRPAWPPPSQMRAAPESISFRKGPPTAFPSATPKGPPPHNACVYVDAMGDVGSNTPLYRVTKSSTPHPPPLAAVTTTIMPAKALVPVDSSLVSSRQPLQPASQLRPQTGVPFRPSPAVVPVQDRQPSSCGKLTTITNALPTKHTSVADSGAGITHTAPSGQASSSEQQPPEAPAIKCSVESTWSDVSACTGISSISSAPGCSELCLAQQRQTNVGTPTKDVKQPGADSATLSPAVASTPQNSSGAAAAGADTAVAYAAKDTQQLQDKSCKSTPVKQLWSSPRNQATSAGQASSIIMQATGVANDDATDRAAFPSASLAAAGIPVTASAAVNLQQRSQQVTPRCVQPNSAVDPAPTHNVQAAIHTSPILHRGSATQLMHDQQKPLAAPATTAALNTRQLSLPPPPTPLPHPRHLMPHPPPLPQQRTVGRSSHLSRSISCGGQSASPAKCQELQLVHFQDLRFGRQIGEGGFGKVYYGHMGHSPVAIKLANLASRDVNQLTREFTRELLTMSSIPPHPHVLRLIAACTEPPHLALVTEFCARGSLYALLHSPATGPLKWPGVLLPLMHGVACGMCHLHRCLVLHRDLKSANILIDASGTALIADFGLSTMYKGKPTLTGGLGTYAWMAPEVLGNQAYSERADVYSFGIVLWECVARRVPYAEMQPMVAALKVLNSGMRPDIPAGTPASLVALIKSCWAAVPDQRPSFEQIAQQLEVMMCEPLTSAPASTDSHSRTSEAGSADGRSAGSSARSAGTATPRSPHGLSGDSK